MLSHLETSVETLTLFRRVRAQLLASTSGQQRPHEYQSLVREHYLSGVSGTAPVTTTVAGDGATTAAKLQQENVFWESIRESTNPGDFEAYLHHYPAGVYRVLATNRLAVLRTSAGDPPAVDPWAPGTVFRDCPTCPEMVVVPAGRFRMGCVSGRDCRSNERPVHEVEIASFALSKSEVTFDEYDRFARVTGRRRRLNDRGWGRGTRPVIDVFSVDAAEYAAWLSKETGEEYRLPSESEWEVPGTCRDDDAVQTGKMTSGATVTTATAAAAAGMATGTAPVCSFAPNDWGFHDMHGNVSEWVEDCWHKNYAGAPRDGSAWLSTETCDRRGYRGGAWPYRPANLRSARRYSGRYRGHDVGFRVARTFK